MHALRRSQSAAWRIALAFCLVACESERQPEPPVGEAITAAVQQLEDRLRRAMISADTVTLGALWAPEYLSTSAVGHTSSRTEALTAYGAGLVKVDSAVLRDVEIRPYGTTAVSLGFLDWSGSAAGRPFHNSVRFLHVWVLGDSTWRLVASQLTNQPAAMPPR